MNAGKRFINIFVISMTIIFLYVQHAWGEPPGLLKKLYNIQGKRYLSDFRNEIANTPKGIRTDFLLISKDAILIGENYMLWVGKELHRELQPAFANEICRKYGGTFDSEKSKHSITEENLTFDQMVESEDIVNDYVCWKNDKSSLFTMKMNSGNVLV